MMMKSFFTNEKKEERDQTSIENSNYPRLKIVFEVDIDKTILK